MGKKEEKKNYIIHFITSKEIPYGTQITILSSTKQEVKGKWQIKALTSTHSIELIFTEDQTIPTERFVVLKRVKKNSNEFINSAVSVESLDSKSEEIERKLLSSFNFAY